MGLFDKEWLESCNEADKQEKCRWCDKPKTHLVFNPNGCAFPACDDHKPSWDCAKKPLNKVFDDMPSDW